MPEAEAALGIEFLERCAVPRQQLGIILIEAGVGITVTGVLLIMFHAFAARDPT